MDSGIQIRGKTPAEAGRVLTPDALAFVATLSRKFEPTRRALLSRRAERQERFDAGELPRFLPETESIRKRDWKVASTPGGSPEAMGRDHRAGRAQDDDRRLQLRGGRLHGGFRGFALSDLGQRRQRPGQSHRRRPQEDRVRQPRGQGLGVGRMREAAQILDSLVEADQFVEFLTLPAYQHLE